MKKRVLEADDRHDDPGRTNQPRSLASQKLSTTPLIPQRLEGLKNVIAIVDKKRVSLDSRRLQTLDPTDFLPVFEATSARSNTLPYGV
jgi:hypothetical protein